MTTDFATVTPQRRPYCAKCANLGHTDFRQVQAGYTSAEIQFCDCEAGIQHRKDVLAYESARRAKHFEAHFQRAGVPAAYMPYSVDTWAQRAGADPSKHAALTAAKTWLRGEDTEKDGIFLYGPPGTGKTGLLTAAFVERMRTTQERGVWLEWFDFVDEVQGRYGKGDGTAQETVAMAQGVDLLLLDDCGNAKRTTEETEDKQRLMYQIVNARVNARTPLLMTSNLSEAAFVMQFGERTWARIAYRCHVIRVAGTDWRKEDTHGTR